MTTIGLLHPGEMGAAIGATLNDAGHTVLWDPDGRSAETRARAQAAGLTGCHTIVDLASRAEVILSVCPPHAALAVARELRGFSGLYIHANAVAPNTARSIARVHPRLVDGGIIGGPPVKRDTTRLYLSGPEAPSAAQLFAGTTLDVRVISEEIGAASALKMAYAAWTKGTAAMLLAVRALALAEGVEPTLLAEFALSQPELEERSRGAARSAVAKGWRWEGEMTEIAATFSAAGLPDGFHLAAAEIFARAPRGAADGGDPVDQVLDALLTRGR